MYRAYDPDDGPLTPEILHPDCHQCVAETNTPDALPKQLWDEEAAVEIFNEMYFREPGGLSEIKAPRNRYSDNKLHLIPAHLLDLLVKCHELTGRTFKSILVRD